MNQPEKTEADEIEQLVNQVLFIPYPDYNMGLLPDEEGYDEVQVSRNWDIVNRRTDTKAFIQRLLDRRELETLEKADVMVDDTVMFLTNNLPSLLHQDEVAKIRRIHKDEIHRNINEAQAALKKKLGEDHA